MTRSSLLFIGYRLRDTNFRVIHRGLVEQMDTSQRSLSVTVQMDPPEHPEGGSDRAQKFMEAYFQKMNICVYWGTASAFAKELKERWAKYNRTYGDLQRAQPSQEGVV